MEKLKSLNLKIKVRGLDEFREDLDQLTIEFKKLENIMGRINDIVEEINEMELVVDVDRDESKKGTLKAPQMNNISISDDVNSKDIEKIKSTIESKFAQSQYLE